MLNGIRKIQIPYLPPWNFNFKKIFSNSKRKIFEIIKIFQFRNIKYKAKNTRKLAIESNRIESNLSNLSNRIESNRIESNVAPSARSTKRNFFLLFPPFPLFNLTSSILGLALGAKFDRPFPSIYVLYCKIFEIKKFFNFEMRRIWAADETKNRSLCTKRIDILDPE